ncbi:MAG: NAD(P)/FAD-dependent oxidoreductase [Candidatus Krumholzibacteria bacterium]|nr:NAD(P)/FAD-dependent oxidoreductase [Candidatus Krumholzibacteria bacterium]MDH4336750.1 NAD(P)/FAD-dependent oxidoreductase [Candidatus Krumholzibacteria bacterium]MDH5270475.1 NAD(P)/FAD-dependent oxidoreductase [Candidatus Krumholzibacteria bacterium]
MKRRSCDIAVVGAGPAGSATALYAARAGLDVVLLDRHTFPRDKICGDAVARKSVAHLRELGVLDRVRADVHEPIGRALLASPRGDAIEVDLSSPETPDPHLVCRREILDNALVEAARSRCTVLEGARVTDVLRDGSRVTGVSFATREGTGEVHARAVVGADGFDSVVARRLGLYRHDSARWCVATRGYYRGLDVAPRTVEIHFLRESLPGFLWIFPTGDGIANVGLGIVHAELKKRRGGLREMHEAALALPRFRERFRGVERIGNVHGWNLPTPDVSRTIAGNGFLLTGDAAGLVDPFSGEGIGNALDSGQVAAEVMRDVPPEAFALEYPARLWRALDGGEIALHYRLRRLARHAGLIDFIVGRAAARPDVLEWIRRMTAARDAVASKRALVSPLTYARLLLRR